MPGTLMVTRELPGGNRPYDLSLLHSLTCKSVVILDYYGVWRT